MTADLSKDQNELRQPACSFLSGFAPSREPWFVTRGRMAHAKTLSREEDDA